MFLMKNLNRVFVSFILTFVCIMTNAQDIKISGTVVSGADNEAHHRGFRHRKGH